MSEELDRLYREFGGLLGAALSARLDTLARLLGLAALELEGVSRSPIEDGAFRLTGALPAPEGGFSVTVTVAEGGPEGTLALRAARGLGGVPLKELYHVPGARGAEDFYSARDDRWFDGILVREQAVWADAATGGAGVELTLVFTPDCPMLGRYHALTPAPGLPIVFAGEMETPLAEGVRLTVRGVYPLELSLPMVRVTPVREAALWIDTGVFDELDIDNYPLEGRNRFIKRTDVVWSGHVDLGYEGLRDLWLSFHLFDHAQRFDVTADFGERGLSVADVAGLLASLSGREGMPELPDWLILKDVALYDASFRLQKPVSSVETWAEQAGGGDGPLDSVAITLGLDLPRLPIPFFDTESGARVTLRILWDILPLGGSLSAVVAFRAGWRGYQLTFNLTIPGLVAQARLFKEQNEAILSARGNNIFPGFLGLSIKDVSAYGDLREEHYALSFELENESGISFPLIGKKCAITSAAGAVDYSTLGVRLSLSLGFTLFGAGFYLSGSYESRGEQTLLTLGGGLSAPLRLSTLLKELLDLTPPESLDLEISLLRLRYSALLEHTTGSLTDSKERSLGFQCAVRFQWDLLPGEALTVESAFALDWSDKAGVRMSLSGALSLMKFRIAASCELVTDGSLHLDHYRFLLSLGPTQFTAQRDTARGTLAIRLTDFNLGELLEALIGTIARDANWYLPWPFQILKRVTLRELEVVYDSKAGTIEAVYRPELNILFFTVERITITYHSQGQEQFLLDLELSGLPQEREAGVWDVLIRSSGQFPLELLSGTFPAFSFLGSKVFQLRYLGIGQHIKAELPGEVSGESIPRAIEALREGIGREGGPRLDPGNNWLAGVDLLLLNSIRVTLLLCDPRFYGLRVGITEGSDVTRDFAGLELVVLYRKVTASIGVFQARLALPEAYRRLELGAVSFRLGDIELAVYTNGNFLVDLGFPHGGDFSRSFGLAFGIFSGQGGLYFGALNGDTSQRVPRVRAGSFGAVVELGMGVTAGIGREFRAGPLSAGAYVRLTAIFEGVFSAYTPPGEENSYPFYRVSATVGIMAKIYGEVDFVVISAGFSLEFGAFATLALESHRASLLALRLELRVSAYLKILFIRISFSFSFTWEDSFSFGQDIEAPWDRYLEAPAQGAPRLAAPRAAVPAPTWYDGAVLDGIQDLQAEVTPCFSYDGLGADGTGGKRKIGWLVCLQGYQGDTLRYLSYAGAVGDTPLPILVTAMLRRVFRSYSLSGELDAAALEALETAFTENGHGGFTLEHLEPFFSSNVVFHLVDSTEAAFEGEIHGVPMPCPPVLTLTWRTGAEAQSYDLRTDPPVPDDFSQRVRAYFSDLSALTAVRTPASYAAGAVNGVLSASAVLFCDYFYMLAKVALAQAAAVLARSGQAAMDAEALIDLVAETGLDAITGQLSRFLLCGLRVPPEGDGAPVSLYEYAHQQFNGAPDGGDPETEAHRLAIAVMPDCGYVALGRRETLRDARSGIGLLSAYSPAERLEIVLKNRDLDYPEGTLMDKAPVLAPLCLWRDAVTELGAAFPLEGHGALYEAGDALPAGGYGILYYDAAGTPHPLDHTAVYAVRIPLEAVREGFYSVGGLDGRSRAALALLRGVGAAELSFFRAADTFDGGAARGAGEEGARLISVDADGIFLYRSNLCLEAEKPLRLSEESGIDSAYAATQPGAFLALLGEACLVNARGYYLRCALPGHAVEEGAAVLTLLIKTDGVSGNAVILPEGFTSGATRPVISDGSRIAEPVLVQGQLAFSLQALEPGEENRLGQSFHLLTYWLCGDEGVRQSRESLPVFPRSEADAADGAEQSYGQVVPVGRFLDGAADDPYRGVAERLTLTLRFALLDILGNRTADGPDISIQYGYCDRLLSPAAYPHIQCGYGLSGEGGRVRLTVAFDYREDGPDAGARADLETAFQQLRQADVRLEARVFGAWYSLDKGELVAFLDAARKLRAARAHAALDPAPPEGVRLSVLTQTPADCLLERAGALLRISRDEDLLMPALRGRPEGESVQSVACALVYGGGQAPELNLARDAAGEVFILRRAVPRFTGVSYWALPPLSTHLLTLCDVPVKALDGSEETASFTEVDPEVWMDQFLRDVEDAAGPGGGLAGSGEHQPQLEALLAAKRDLAGGLSRLVTHVTGDSPQARAAAEAAFCQAMLRDLSLGRKINAVAVLESDTVPEQPQSRFLGQVSGAGADLAAGKLGTDGLLAVSVRAREVGAQKQLGLHLRYTLTDWEIGVQEGYGYLTLLNPPVSEVDLEVPIPYRQYPDRVELQSHTGLAAWEPGREGETGRDPDPRTLFAWNYELRLAHRTAAQDTITIELFHDRVVLAGEERASLWDTLARYQHLREALWSDLPAHADTFIQRVREVADALALPSAMEDGDRPSERFAFTLERDRGCIAVVENTLRYVPGLALETADGSYTELRYDKEKLVYLLPENYSGEVLRCKLTCRGYHIAEENITNAAVTVTRNANIPGIAPVFVYRTPTCAFPAALLPSLTLTNPIALGLWSRDSFIGRLRELWSEFGTVSVELLYGRRLAEDLYARLPILYAPGISTGNPARLGELFEGVEEWCRDHITATEGDLIQCGMTFFSAQDPAYNLAEVRELRFTL